MRNRRGSILVHVLISAVVISVIAAGLAQMLMQRYTITAKVTAGAGGRGQNVGSLNRVITAWNASNQVCSAVPGFSCTGTPGVCGCTCAPSPACVCAGPGSCPGTVVAADSGGRCSVTITSCP